jgi:SPP1 family predicted phage head-tail adaptor
MRAGRLRHLVDIQRATESADSYGSTALTWASIAKRTAGIEPVSSKEQLANDQIIGRQLVKVMLRYEQHLLLTSADRIVWGSRILNIQSVINPGERNRSLELLCVEAV